MHSTPPDSTEPLAPPSALPCTACQKPLDAEFVSALDGTFHWNCFCCLDCGEPVASQYFPIETVDGSQKPICERDYFRRLNLVCDNCGDALRGSYITAVNKKFHLEHFCCCICNEVFGPDDSYYEHGTNVYCHYHYSTRFAIKCSGCQAAILKQFVEINRNNVDEHWHPECYVIHKFWNVKLSSPGSESASLVESATLDKVSASELMEAQTALEEKVYRIWTVLSAFEESAAACISDMLLQVSEGGYAEGLKMADYFIAHVHVLFAAIDDLALEYYEKLHEHLNYDRESRMLCKKVENFFSLLSHTQEHGLRRIGTTQELLSLVTGLAHYLKVLIRVGLIGALQLEQSPDAKSTAISQFLSRLMELATKQNSLPPHTSKDMSITLDLCYQCRKSCKDRCFRFEQCRWHDDCFACSQCNTSLVDNYAKARVHRVDYIPYCHPCAEKSPDEFLQGVQRVTQLQQFSFLLRVALRRLYHLLNVPDPTTINGEEADRPVITHGPGYEDTSKETKAIESINLRDIKRVKSTHIDRTNPNRIAKRSTLMETPSPNAAYVTNQPGDVRGDERPISLLSDAPSKTEIPGDLPGYMPQQSPHQSYIKAKPKAKCYYFAELGALDHFMIKHIAVLHLDELLADHFSLEELADLIDDKKNSTLWGKFVTSLKAGGGKKAPRLKEGTFGVPLDVLVEKNGVESTHGAGPTRIRIPALIEDCISAMKQMDMSVEGVFRKNGNIRRLKELSEEIDRNPGGVDLMTESAVQVAALTKKFLRDMPEPLLTFRLHKLFVVAQKLDSTADKKRVLHLACCLLPKPNRDTMEVLFLFMKWVAGFAHTGEDTGSKMDLDNIATVLAPNIIYSKGKDPIMDESLCCIQAVYMLLDYQEEFSTVPEDFVPLLQNLTYSEGDMELNARQLLKKCELVMKMKRSHSTGQGPPPMMPRQHSSPATTPVTPDIPSDSPFQLSASPVEITQWATGGPALMRSQSSSNLKDSTALIAMSQNGSS